MLKKIVPETGTKIMVPASGVCVDLVWSCSGTRFQLRIERSTVVPQTVPVSGVSVISTRIAMLLSASLQLSSSIMVM